MRFARTGDGGAGVQRDERLDLAVASEQIERTERYAPVVGLPVLRDDRPGTVVPLRGVGRRKHGRREMHRRGKHVARGERILHHVRVTLLGVAACEPVKPIQAPVRGMDERTGSAGVVGNAGSS